MPLLDQIVVLVVFLHRDYSLRRGRDESAETR
jgi:hypothetical protein